MSEPVLTCPECGSDRVTAEHHQKFMVNTSEHYCHSVKTHDALEAQARKSSCCVMRVRRLVLRVSAMFTWPSVGLIGVT